MAAVPLDGAVPVCDRTERIRHAVSLRRTDMPSQPLATNRNPRKPSPVSSHVTPLCHTAAWPPLYRIYLSRAPCAASAHGLRPVVSQSQRPAWSLRSKGLATSEPCRFSHELREGSTLNQLLFAPYPLRPGRLFVLPTLEPPPPPQGGTSVLLP